MIILFLPKKVKDSIKSNKPFHEFIVAISGFVFWYILLVIGFIILEKMPWFNAIWQGWETNSTVGYGENPAVTILGRIWVMVSGTGGIAFLGASFGAFFNWRAYKEQMRRCGMVKNPFRDGYVLAGYPGTTMTQIYIREIRSSEADVGICIVDSQLEELPRSIATLPDIHFVKGNLLSEETYEMARMKENKVVIVFPNDPSSSDSDGQTNSIVELIERFVGDDVAIQHFLVDERNQHMFSNKRSTPILLNVAILFSVQECQDPCTAPIIQKLLKNTEGANPQTVKPVLITGMSWVDFQIKSIKTAKEMGISVNPFAIVQHGQTFTCPDMDCKICEGDVISLIAHHDFDWREFEKKLVEQ